MHHHTVTTVLDAPCGDVFAYLADIENLPEWATEFARELRLADGRAKVVNGLGEFCFRIDADPATGVIDMLAGPTEERLPPLPPPPPPPSGARRPGPLTIVPAGG